MSVIETFFRALVGSNGKGEAKHPDDESREQHRASDRPLVLLSGRGIVAFRVAPPHLRRKDSQG